MKKPEFELHISETDNFVRYDFDRRIVKKAMRSASKIVRERAKRLVNVTGKRNNYPNKITGTLYKSIRSKVSRSGFMAKVRHERTPKMKAFYPAYLHYGVKNKPPGTSIRARRNLATSWRIKPRNNYIVDALRSTRRQVSRILIDGFKEALWNGK